MLFMVGIEVPENEDTAYGIIVPVFEKVGYGCASAADKREDILNQAKLAILDMAEEVINDGILPKALNEGFQHYQSEYPEFKEWIAVEVPIESLSGKQKRINITLSEPFLARIDAFVEIHSEYKDRSDFLSKAADNLIVHHH